MLAEASGGWGPCPKVPGGVADKFKQEMMDKKLAKDRMKASEASRETNDVQAGLGMPTIASMFDNAGSAAMDEAFQDLAYSNPQIPASFLSGNAFKEPGKTRRSARASRPT